LRSFANGEAEARRDVRAAKPGWKVRGAIIAVQIAMISSRHDLTWRRQFVDSTARRRNTTGVRCRQISGKMVAYSLLE
jgi:hypothetical protein